MISKKYECIVVKGEKATVEEISMRTDKYNDFFGIQSKLCDLSELEYLEKISDFTLSRRYKLDQFIDYDFSDSYSSFSINNYSSLISIIKEKYRISINDFIVSSENVKVLDLDADIKLVLGRCLKKAAIEKIGYVISSNKDKAIDSFKEDLNIRKEIAFYKHSIQGWSSQAYKVGDLKIFWRTNYGYQSSSYDYFTVTFEGKPYYNSIGNNTYFSSLSGTKMTGFNRVADYISLYLSDKRAFFKQYCLSQIDLMKKLIIKEERSIIDLENIYLPSLERELAVLRQEYEVLNEKETAAEEDQLVKKKELKSLRISIGDIEESILESTSISARTCINLSERAASPQHKRENIIYLKSEVNALIDMYNREDTLMDKF